MDSVKVALRIRPLVKHEIENGCQSCIERIPNEPQVGIGKANQLYTFNYVFDELEGQSKVYNESVKHLIENLFKGYNLTILAYGQTGSGKTYTMGTNYSGTEEMGVIPRAVYDIFEIIESTKENSFKVTVSFIELYNESLYDLLTNKPREQSIVDMREQNNTVIMPTLTEIEVTNPVDTLDKLKEGSLGRMVGATAMNAQSSRSHAIFTVNITIIPIDNPKETMMSKFHLVDLAGSERSKKTGATGDRFREGVNINKGLLILGNVISQLGGEGNHSFINYRDSKLTRLLQDSLGGNSFTLMIACISPADYNQDESSSTLRYADRAKKIKNKPIINQDPFVAEMSRLRKENEELRLKLIEGGDSTFDCSSNYKYLELMEKEKRIKELQANLAEALSENSRNYERNIMEEKMRSSLKDKLSHLIEVCEKTDEDPTSLFNEMKSMIFEVKAEHIRSEQELISFEKRTHLQITASGEGDEHDTNGGENDVEDDDDMSSPINQEHVTSQALINEQIMKLTKSLALKEDLMTKMCESSDYLSSMESASQINIQQMKNQIAELQKEREELKQQLKMSTSDKSTCSKIAEQRRKRLQELEHKVTQLTKKIVEQERIIKIKENSDVKISNLKREITEMKQMKVKLVHQMKTESEKFRIWRTQKDKELHSLKNQNLKKQNQLKKMEIQHSLQQNVLKRKLEAAAAANKRIMAVLERQKSCRIKRANKPVLEEIKDRVHEDLELIESSYQAEKSLESLIQDRGILSRELNIIKENLKDLTLSIRNKNSLSLDKKKIEHELALRSAEISDLQQKMSDIQDELKKNSWEMVPTLVDAKQALIYVFNLLAEKAKENLNKSYIITENEALKHEKVLEVEKYKIQLNDYLDFHQRSLEAVEKESEDRVVELLDLLSAKLAEQNPENETISKQMEIIHSLRKEKYQLKEEKNNANPRISTYEDAFNRFIHDYDTSQSTDQHIPVTNRKSRPTNISPQSNCNEADCDLMKENCDCNVNCAPLNETFTKEDLNQEDIDSLNELAPPKRMRFDKRNNDTRKVLKQLNN